MKMKPISIATVSVVALTLSIVPALSNVDNDEGSHKYTIGVEGTKGVKLRMLLVAKPSATRAPIRKSKIITIPFQTTLNARSFYVWFDTLDAGASGKDGDRIMSIYKIDGEQQGGGFGATIKKENMKTYSFGNL